MLNQTASNKVTHRRRSTGWFLVHWVINNDTTICRVLYTLISGKFELTGYVHITLIGYFHVYRHIFAFQKQREASFRAAGYK